MGHNPNWQNDYAQQNRRNNNGFGGQNGGSRNNYGGQNGGYRNTLPPKLDAEALPSDYVEKAEDVIRKIGETCEKKNQITTSKLRNLYSLVTEIYDREQLRTEAALLDTSVSGLQRMRVRLAYESGRDLATQSFVREAKLIPYLKGVGTNRKALLNFAHYMEALVAYHRYYHLGNEK